MRDCMGAAYLGSAFFSLCWHWEGPSPAAQSLSGVCVSKTSALQFVKIVLLV